MHCVVVITLILAAITAVVESQPDCANVDCKNYDFTITKLDQAKPDRFCSWRVSKRNNNQLTIRNFKDKNNIKTCTADNNTFFATRMPEGHEDIMALAGDKDFKLCCAKKVVKECYYRARIYVWKCKDDNPDNDVMNRVEVIFRDSNEAQVKVVLNSYDADTYSAECTHTDPDGNEATINVDNSPPSDKKEITDCGMGVQIEKGIKTYKNKYTTVELRAKRPSCNSQNVNLFRERTVEEVADMDNDEPKPATGDLKFSTNTRINTDLENDGEFDGVYLSPILAQINEGECGNRVQSVEVTKKTGCQATASP